MVMRRVALISRTSSTIMQFAQNVGKIVDFFYPGLEDVEMASSKLTGYQINKHRLEVYGLCPDCQTKAEE